jgi:hypothetical protein
MIFFKILGLCVCVCGLFENFKQFSVLFSCVFILILIFELLLNSLIHQNYYEMTENEI